MKKYFLLLLTSLVFFTSCEDDFLDINTNPNRSTSVPPGTLMMNAAISLSQVRLTGLNPDGAAYIQHWKPIVVLRDPDTYEFGEIPNNNFWEFTFYQDVIKDLNLAIGAAEADDNQNVVAQLRLLQAFGWIHGVDRWGTMPFDQAVNSEFQFPEYNTGPEIYQGILDLIDDAMGRIDLANTGEPNTIVNFDHIYGGDMEKWQAFGNTLKLRVLMRLSYVQETERSAEISALLGSDAEFIDELNGSEDAKFRYFPARTNQNFDYATFDNFTGFGSFLPSAADRQHQAWRLASKATVDLLTADNDPRLTSFFQPNFQSPDGSFVGAVNGAAPLPASSERGYVSLFYIRQDKADDWIMASEYWLLVAEARSRNIVSGDAQEAMEMGVRAHLNIFDGSDFEISESDKVDYINSLTVTTDEIQTELYKALFYNGVEAWSHWRRTKRPALTPAVGGPITTVISRLPLPQSTLSSNPNSPPVSPLRDDPLFFERL